MKKIFKKIIIILAISSLFTRLLCLFLKKEKVQKIKDNFKKFLKEENREIEEFKNDKEDFSEYCKDSSCIFIKYFIPHKINDYKPKILNTKPLIYIALSIFIFKIVVLSYVFFVYPFKAQMGENLDVRLLELINIERVSNNLEPLKLNNNLNNASLAKAQNMIDLDYFSHYGPDGRKPWDWIDRKSYQYIYAGENLAMNFLSAKSAHEALMQSPTHKKNILNPRYEDVGISIIEGELKGEKTLVLVQIFACSSKENIVGVAMASASENEEIKKKEIEKIEKENEEEVVLDTPKAVEVDLPKIKDTKIEEVVPVELKSHKTTKTVVLDSSKDVVKTKIEKNNEVENIIDLSEKNEAKNDLFIEKVENEKILDDSKIVMLESEDGLEEKLDEEKLVMYTRKTSVHSRRVGLASEILTGLKYVYSSMLILSIFILFINIVVKINVQHKGAIIKTMIFIIFIGGLSVINNQILEKLVDKVIII